MARIGFESIKSHGLWDFAFRLGYGFEPSPVPDQTGITNFVDSDKHVISVGFGLSKAFKDAALNGPVSLDVHYQLIQFEARNVRKDNPADFIGDYQSFGAIHGVGATMGVQF